MNSRVSLVLLGVVLVGGLSLLVYVGWALFEDEGTGPSLTDRADVEGGDTPARPGEEPPAPEPPPSPGPAASPETLRRFQALLDGPGWAPADPPQNPQGMLVAIHEQSRLAFVLVPAGSFEMGSRTGMEDEKPVRRARVGPFLLSATECTITADNLVFLSSRLTSDSPRDWVSWNHAAKWCETASPNLRLPTEAEWEYACRAGSKGRFCFGDDPERLPEYAWFADNSGGGPHPVATLLPNAWGFFDMHGNLWEWCADEWRGESARVYRGGSFLNIPFNCRSANRSRDEPDAAYRYLGFRPAADLP